MSTGTCWLASRAPTRPLAGSSSLPPELKNLLNQFGGAFWQFDATEIAHMFSPTYSPSSTLVDVAYSLLKQDSSAWPKGPEDATFHKPLVDSLNDFLKASHLALDLSDPPIISMGERWYSGLRFMPFVDGTCSTHDRDRGPVKREAVGGVFFREGEETELAIPIKLDEDWPTVVAQAARSAQILLATCPSRKFGVVIGFRRTTLELRFLISHRGGLTGSKPLSVVEEKGKRDILRVFLCMLMWRTKEDAGMLVYDTGADGA